MGILRKVKKALLLLILLSGTLGFRVYPGKFRWNILAADPKLFLLPCQVPQIGTNDLPETDPLYNQPLGFNEAFASIINDYNTLTHSFVRLADGRTDGDFATLGSDRTIDICFEAPGGVASGMAKPIYRDDQIIGCTIKISLTTLGSAKNFIATLTHEIGHCLGLDHPQETTKSIMSYFAADLNRLQLDDKMGLAYLFPVSPGEVTEEPTFGLSCTPKSKGE